MKVCKMGFIGAATAMLLTSMLNMILVMVYMSVFAEHRISPFAHFSWQKLMKKKAIDEYMTLALPCIAMVCASFWAIEIL